MLCKTCEKRKGCKKLCKEAAEYVSQDVASKAPESSENELGVSIDSFPDDEILWKDVFGTRKSSRRVVYELHFIQKKEVCEIMYHIPEDRDFILSVLSDLQSNLPTKNNLKSKVLQMHFIGRKKISQILREMSVSRKHVQNSIAEHLVKNKI